MAITMDERARGDTSSTAGRLDGLVEALMEVAREVLEGRKEVVAAYLYGSLLSGGPADDVDIGLLLAPGFRPGPLYGAEVAGQLEEKLKGKVAGLQKLVREGLDVRVLNGRPARFLHSMLRNSLILFCRDEKARIGFESRVLLDYLDMKPHHERYDRVRRLRYTRAGQKPRGGKDRHNREKPQIPRGIQRGRRS